MYQTRTPKGDFLATYPTIEAARAAITGTHNIICYSPEAIAQENALRTDLSVALKKEPMPVYFNQNPDFFNEFGSAITELFHLERTSKSRPYLVSRGRA